MINNSWFNFEALPGSFQYLACRQYMVTTILDTLIKQYLSQEYADRTKNHMEETKELSE